MNFFKSWDIFKRLIFVSMFFQNSKKFYNGRELGLFPTLPQTPVSPVSVTGSITKTQI